MDFGAISKMGETWGGVIHFSGIDYILIIVQLSLPSVSKTFPSSRTETVPIKQFSIIPSSPPLATTILFSVYEFDYFRDLISAESYRVVPFFTDLFHLA